MRKARYKVFTMGSASHRLQRCLCVTETEGEEPLAFRITVEKRHVVGTENPVIADLPIGADARGQRTANVSEGRRRLFRARGGMAAFARTPVFPVAEVDRRPNRTLRWWRADLRGVISQVTAEPGEPGAGAGADLPTSSTDRRNDFALSKTLERGRVSVRPAAIWG